MCVCCEVQQTLVQTLTRHTAIQACAIVLEGFRRQVSVGVVCCSHLLKLQVCCLLSSCCKHQLAVYCGHV